ncbi:hypothetical protein KTO58_02660 [Chitinophaga pendula]|uniref:hypothetical protein n=1 Tax=Chitinophaga TaxID=79328 RepID=UPI000BB04286|nr:MULTISPECIES: hypothetical protein [Chitinophaga]ASZ14255.1 hypothetical protein CK934_26560 [Chitinophaga sp. MD30]UCJ08101.1 hypothetical protein KTO58_02660 [Chitinophaga pendula]
MAVNNARDFVVSKKQIGIVFDTAYLRTQPSGSGPDTGIYMVDNALAEGSSDEDGQELVTVCKVNDTVSWYAVPMNPTLNDTVVITGWSFNNGDTYDIFNGGQGKPASVNGEDTGNYWAGKVFKSTDGTEVGYQLQILITYGADGYQHPINWDPFIVVK